jgi:2-hydroxychromene-2-carboxylate isomerase
MQARKDRLGVVLTRVGPTVRAHGNQTRLSAAPRGPEGAAEAHSAGAFGVPTFVVDDRMFWGNDRLVLVRHFLKK